MTKLSKISLTLEIENEDGTVEERVLRFDEDIDALPTARRHLMQTHRINEAAEIISALMKKAVGLQ